MILARCLLYCDKQLRVDMFGLKCCLRARNAFQHQETCLMNSKTAKFDPNIFGERGGTRTLDPMIKSHVLYRLSYALT